MRTLLIAGSLLLLGGGSNCVAASGTQWRANYFPDVRLVTQDGKRVRFYNDLIKDKVVAISFIFTRCTGPCPAETASLRQVEKTLGDRVGRDVFLYSISIDPKHDTPRVLDAYKKKFNAGPNWTFLTGKEEDIKLLRRKLGVYSAGNQPEKLNDHNVNFVVGNEATGQWIKRSPFDNPKALARLLGNTLQSMPMAKPGELSYAAAPRLPTISKGEDVFRSRCVSCHSLGIDDGIGPGLAGVTKKRDRAWLARWLKAPDELLAKGDPIAIALLARYKKLRMPNLQLSDAEVDAVLGFMAKF